MSDNKSADISSSTAATPLPKATKEHVDFLHQRINDLEALVHKMAHFITVTDRAVADGVKLTIKEIHDAYNEKKAATDDGANT